MTWDDVIGVGARFPGVETSTSYGTPALKVRGKLLTRLRLEDVSLVLLDVGFDEREMLVEAEPHVFHFTDHYRSYPAVLARLDALEPAMLTGFLERRWRGVATSAMVRLWEASKPGEA